MAEKNMNAKISVEFEETANRQQLSSGDNLPTLFGKIKKFFIDLKAVAFSGSYNDLSDTPTTATTDTDGLMSAEDKSKLDSVDDTYALKSLYGDTTINVGRKADTSVGLYSTAEGYKTIASGRETHAEGDQTTASGTFSHAEGYISIAGGTASHAEGSHTTASGNSSHSEGGNTTASGDNSHSEGGSYRKLSSVITDFSSETTNNDIISAWTNTKFSLAKGSSSHSEGYDTLALGNYSHAEGCNTTASGISSHAEGLSTTASGHNSHAEGLGTIASKNAESASGKYNLSNSDTLFSIGDGTADDARHNAFEITTTGGKLHDKDIATTDLIPTELPANGGNADTLDGLHADYFAKYDNPSIEGQISLVRAGNATTADSIFAWEDTLRLRNQDPNAENTTYTDLLLTPSGIFTEGLQNGTYISRQQIYGGRPYIMGSGSVEAFSDTCVSNHGFAPSAVFWWDADMYTHTAVSFDSTSFTINESSNVAHTISYIIFK